MPSSKQSVQDMPISIIKRVIRDAKQTESYLFLGKAFDDAFDKALADIPSPKCFMVQTYSAKDADFKINDLIDTCTKSHAAEGFVVVLRLGNQGIAYQKSLLVPLERLTLPLLIFVDDDNLSEPFMSRFDIERIHKILNDDLQVREFIPPDKALAQQHRVSPYDCPSLIKLGEKYSKLPQYNKEIDMLISLLSGGNVYTEVLSELKPPIKTFDKIVKLEALSILKK